MGRTVSQLKEAAEIAKKRAIEAEKKLKEAERAIAQKEKIQQRKDETRRKVIFGGFLLAKRGKDNPFVEKLYDEFRNSLTKDSDRKLFGLDPLSKIDATPPPPPLLDSSFNELDSIIETEENAVS